MSNKEDKNKGGRPKGMTKEKAFEKKENMAIIRNMDRQDTQSDIARNHLLYNFNKFGLHSFDVAKEAYQNTELTTGFEMAILGLYKKAAEGDLKAIELMMKISGSIVEKIDNVSSDGSMTPKNTNINIPLEISKEEKKEILNRALELNENGEF